MTARTMAIRVGPPARCACPPGSVWPTESGQCRYCGLMVPLPGRQRALGIVRMALAACVVAALVLSMAFVVPGVPR